MSNVLSDLAKFEQELRHIARDRAEAERDGAARTKALADAKREYMQHVQAGGDGRTEAKLRRKVEQLERRQVPTLFGRSTVDAEVKNRLAKLTEAERAVLGKRDAFIRAHQTAIIADKIAAANRARQRVLDAVEALKAADKEWRAEAASWRVVTDALLLDKRWLRQSPLENALADIGIRLAKHGGWPAPRRFVAEESSDIIIDKRSPELIAAAGRRSPR